MKAVSLDYRLITSDCIAGMRGLAGNSVDVIITSPPYNLGIKYGKYRDDEGRDDYLRWSIEWAKEALRVLKDDGSFFLNVGASPSNPFFPHELLVKLKGEEVGFVLQNTFHWIKSITVQFKNGDLASAGHFKPLHSDRFVNDCHEYVFHLTKTGNTRLNRLSIGVPYSDKSNIKRWSHTKGKDLRCRGNNWFIPYKTIVSRSRQRPHPATFPVELAANCLKIHGVKPATIVLDPFVGIGHAALAARACGVRRFIGFDVDPRYIRIAKRALERA